MKVNIDRYFPLEVIIEILSWLSVKSLLRFKCVSKLWYDLTNDPKFIKLHLNRSIVDNNTFVLKSYHDQQFIKLKVNCDVHPYYEVSDYCFNFRRDQIIKESKINLVGSCNGLLCLTSCNNSSGDCDFFLYNPATRAFKTLPRFKMDVSIMITTYMFGYDGVSDDYKVLKFMEWFGYNLQMGKQDSTILYSLKNNSWEVVENPPWGNKGGNVINFEPGCCFNVLVSNSFHWLNLIRSKKIKCFDLITRRYYEKPVPDDINTHNKTPRLTILRGNLCLVTCNLDIWMLKEYNNDKSWTRLFHCNKFEECNTFDYNCFIREWNHQYTNNVACLIDGRSIILVVKLNYKSTQQFLICCDLESQEARKTVITGLPCGTRFANAVLPWAESLVPLP